MIKNITVIFSHNQFLDNLAKSFHLEKASKGYTQWLQSLF
jgi:hypothetical protein